MRACLDSDLFVIFNYLNEERGAIRSAKTKGTPLQNKCINFCTLNLFSFFLASFEESVECVDPGAFVTVLFLWWLAHLCFFHDVPLFCLLKLSSWGCTWTAQTLLQHMGICRLYPLVVILFCFDDLKAKLLVKVNG